MADPLISELQDKEQDHNRNKDDQWEEWKNIKGKRKEELNIKNDKENKNTNFLEEESRMRKLNKKENKRQQKVKGLSWPKLLTSVWLSFVWVELIERKNDWPQDDQIKPWAFRINNKIQLNVQYTM